MTIAISLPRPPARAAVRIGRAVGGVGVFAATVVAWLAFQQWQVDRSPLPGSDGRQGECAVWFVGSSTIFRWATLDRDMAPWAAHNRGIGGARLGYVLRRFDNESDAIRPGAIVFYAGENDIAAGDDVATTVGYFRHFLALKTQKYGALPVVAISLKPSPTRWDNRPQQRAFNAAIRRIAAARRDVTYVDIVPEMLVGDRPGPYYEPDGVHMTQRGYALWTPILRRTLVAALPHATVERCG